MKYQPKEDDLVEVTHPYTGLKVTGIIRDVLSEQYHINLSDDLSIFVFKREQLRVLTEDGLNKPNVATDG